MFEKVPLVRIITYGTINVAIANIVPHASPAVANEDEEPPKTGLAIERIKRLSVDAL